MFLYVIIPVFNRRMLTLGCLESLSRNNLNDVEVILIDDGSTDGTAESVIRQFPWVTILKGTGSLWWTGSINLGLKSALRKATCDDAVLLLNNDLEFPENYVAQVRACLTEHKKSLIGSVVMSEEDPDIIRSGGVRVNWLTAKTLNLNEGASLTKLPRDHIENVSILTGRGVAIPVEVFTKIGIYDDKHFSQCGDTDLPRRAALAGYPLIVDYRMIVYNVVENEAHINRRAFYHLRDLKSYYFDRRSNSCIRYRFWLAMSSNRNIMSCILYFIADQIRIAFHFLRNFRV